MVKKFSQAVKPASTKVAVDQDQDQDQSELTVVASLNAVKHLVETSLGCLTYLRGIFPDDHFIDSYVPGGRVTPGSSENIRRNGSIKVKKLERGHSSEGDRFLEYWEFGVQDALDHEYLSSLIVAVYLDENEPENLVESYTFNFSYTSVPGTQKKAVSLNFEEHMSKVSIYEGSKDPVKPTQRDVRSSTQSIIRTLITLTQSLPELPRKRFVTIKLFYTDDTPADYEPPQFQAANDHSFVFRSRLLTQGPDQVDIGPLQTGHHGVSLHISSLAHLLPPAIQEEDEADLVEEGHELSKEARKAMDHKQQVDDAASRTVVWDAEEHSSKVLDLSVDSEAAVGKAQEDGADQAERDRRLRTGIIRGRGDPLGIVSSKGVLRPIPHRALEEAQAREKRRRQGLQVADEDVEDVEMFVAKIVEKEWTSNPRADLAMRSATSHSMAPTIFDPRSLSRGPEGSPTLSPRNGSPGPAQLHYDSQGRPLNESNFLEEINEENGLESQVQTQSQTQSQSQAFSNRKNKKSQESEDPIESYSTQQHSGSLRSSPRKRASASTSTTSKAGQLSAWAPAMRVRPGFYYQSISEQGEEGIEEEEEKSGRTTKRNEKEVEEELEMRRKATEMEEKMETIEAKREQIVCDCGDRVEDGLMAQCEAADCFEENSGWVHAACYGYNEKTIESSKAPLFCYEHELRKEDVSSERLESARTTVLNKLASLTLMRRALFVIRRDGWPADIDYLADKIGSDFATASEVTSCLEKEGYIVKVDKARRNRSRSSGPPQTTSKQVKASVVASHTVLKHRQVLKKMNETYFSPKEGAEEEILRLWTEVGGHLLSKMVEKDNVSRAGDMFGGEENLAPFSSQRSVGPHDETAPSNFSQSRRPSQRKSTPPTDPIAIEPRQESPGSPDEEETQMLYDPNESSGANEAWAARVSRPNKGKGREMVEDPISPMKKSTGFGVGAVARNSQGMNSRSPSHLNNPSSSSSIGKKRPHQEAGDEEMENGEQKQDGGEGSTIARSSSYNLRNRMRPVKHWKASLNKSAIALDDDVDMD